MARVTKTPFEFNDSEGVKTKFAIGDEVPDEIAEHWYVQHHTEEPRKGKSAVADKKAEAEGADSK